MKLYLSRGVFAALGTLAVTFASSLAEAQNHRADPTNGGGFDTHLFRPAIDSKGFFTVNGADVVGHKDITVALTVDYGNTIMRLQPGHGESALVTHSFQGVFGFNYGLFNRLVLGVQIPVALDAGGGVTDIGKSGATYDSVNLNGQSLPDIRAHAKVRILNPTGPIGIALIAQVGIPTGSSPARDLQGDSSFWYWPQLALEKDFGDGGVGTVGLGANVGFRGGSFGAATVFDQLKGGHFESANGLVTFGAAASVRILPPVDLVVETYGTKQASGNSSSKVALSDEVVGGFKLFVDKNSYLIIGGGAGVTDGYEAARGRAFLGFSFEPSIGDADGDGIPDDVDQCPDKPEDKDGFEDTDGCPDLDNDGDGIPDKRDHCPNVPEDKDGDQDEDGCPEPDLRDRDKDGILDRDDKCPDQGGNVIRVPGPYYGCADSDNDGIPDNVDKCPTEPEDKDGFEDEDGCPDPDNDKDGIPDNMDHCPNDPETKNGFEDEDGCPDKKPSKVTIEGDKVMVLEKILFETNSAKILPASDGLLADIAATLKDHPDFDLVEVQGHADQRGDAKHNLKLTQDRANAVVDALVTRGVDRKHLRAMGYGKYCPIDPGNDAKALEKNRRVEFKIVSMNGKPTGAELGCEEAKAHGVEPPTN